MERITISWFHEILILKQPRRIGVERARLDEAEQTFSNRADSRELASHEFIESNRT
jgi:hypothetical protein